MKNLTKIILFISVLVFINSCNTRKKNGVDLKEDIFNSKQIKNKLAESDIDSIDNLYYNDKLFFPTIIRLKSGKNYFIYTEMSIQFDSVLNSFNRELYYEKVLKKINKMDLRVHEKVWSFSEVQKMQTGDGGYLTLLTWIDEYPTTNNPYYFVAIKKNMISHFSAAYPISWVKVKKDFSEILFCDAVDCLTPSKWKKEKNCK